MQGAQCGTQSQDSRIMPCIKGRCSTAEPLRSQKSTVFLCNSNKQLEIEIVINFNKAMPFILDSKYEIITNYIFFSNYIFLKELTNTTNICKIPKDNVMFSLIYCLTHLCGSRLLFWLHIDVGVYLYVHRI